ncbi:hypothetical protein G6514_006566 [Epicoccum nigrum]|nr:hypothetical protein G6514_006566 [Epicoccum nigrum]
MAMLAIQPTLSNPSSSSSSSSSKTCTPHLLPARINHNGPIHNTQRYWAPSVDEKGTHHVHFRGRHLHGTPLPIPPGYTGAVLLTTEKVLPRVPKPNPSVMHHLDSDGNGDGEPMYAHERCVDEEGNPADDEGGYMEEEEVKMAQEVGSFEELVVWGHGGVVGEGDEYVRGIREWVGFAEGMHCDEEEEKKVGEGRVEGIDLEMKDR